MNGTPNFNALARPYRWLEYLSFGPFLQRTRTHFLPLLLQVRQALILGDGDGRFTSALLAANPSVHVHAIDGSPAMLRQLTRNAYPHQARLTTEIADLRHWTPPPGRSFDLIATHFFLDCLTTVEVASLANHLAASTESGALWAVSDFAIPASAFGRLLAAPLVAFLYASFRLLTGLRVRQLPDHTAALTAAGWSRQTGAVRLNGLLIAELWRRD